MKERSPAAAKAAAGKTAEDAYLQIQILSDNSFSMTFYNVRSYQPGLTSEYDFYLDSTSWSLIFSAGGETVLTLPDVG